MANLSSNCERTMSGRFKLAAFRPTTTKASALDFTICISSTKSKVSTDQNIAYRSSDNTHVRQNILIEIKIKFHSNELRTPNSKPPKLRRRHTFKPRTSSSKTCTSSQSAAFMRPRPKPGLRLRRHRMNAAHLLMAALNRCCPFFNYGGTDSIPPTTPLNLLNSAPK